MLCTFVDDIIIASSDDKKTDKFIKMLERKGFVISSLEELSWYLGINIIIDFTTGIIKILAPHTVKGPDLFSCS